LRDIIRVETESHLNHIKELFMEYATSLGINLSFQKFDDELANLPGEYVFPKGCMLLAISGGQIAGCVALRSLGDDICEMKRLYVRPQFRGKGLGRSLVQALIVEARRLGYKKMRLDTLPWMKEAIALYRSFGFKEIPPYCYNPIEGVLFMELIL